MIFQARITRLFNKETLLFFATSRVFNSLKP